MGMGRIPVSPRYYESLEEQDGLRHYQHMRAIGEHVYMFTVVEARGMRSILWTRLPLLANEIHMITRRL